MAVRYVILSERSKPKNLRILGLLSSYSVRRSFDFGQSPPLRMTDATIHPHLHTTGGYDLGCEIPAYLL